MSEQHTPGPWHWEADEVKNDPYGRIRYQVTALGKTVTRVFYSTFEGGPTNADADARLIAAAPELLSLVIRYRNETPLGNQPHMIAHEADKVIAKVTGEKP